MSHPPPVRWGVMGTAGIAVRSVIPALQASAGPAVRRVLPLSLTFDHRVVTGGEAARFLVALKTDLEQP